MEKCYNIECACFNKREEDSACEVFTEINLCDESFTLKANKEPVADVLCNVGLCDAEVKEEKTLSGWIQPYVSLRVGNFEFKRNYQTENGATNCVKKINEMLGLTQDT